MDHTKTQNVSDRVVKLLEQEHHRQFKAKELARRLNVPPGNYRWFRDLLKSMANQGLISKFKRNQYGALKQTSTVLGTLHVKSQGYGFLIVGEDEEDVFISQKNMATALNGDQVRVQLFARPTGKKAEGRVVEIVTRARQNIVGLLKKSKHFFYVKPDDLKLFRDVYIAREDLNGAKVGQKVAVQIDSWEDELQNPEGSVIKVLGYPGEKGVDVLSVAYAFDLPADFPPDVKAAAEKIGPEVSAELAAQRLDLRDQLMFTIDPEDAKDFDDAISLRTLDNGNLELGVHIADVSHYVKEKSPLDREAIARGTSVYLVDRVVPMLPEKLSNNICSLRPKTDRLTYSCLMELTPRGRVVSYEIAESVINSNRRFSYEEVEDILRGKQSAGREFDETLIEMNRLAKTLTKRRKRNGSLDFDKPEAKIKLDDNGVPIAIEKKRQLDSHRLVEEFMLLANQTVAKHVNLTLAKKGFRPAFVYRIHEQPDLLKVEDFARFAKALGYHFDHQQTITSKVLSQFLYEIAGKPEEHIIKNMLLRSLMKAKYSIKNQGHFGLAFKHYTHFTSPIRRYPDLVVHRTLKEYQNSLKPELNEIYERKLERAAQRSSERELVALEAERASIKMKLAEYMSTRIGEEFDGLISGVVSFGFFVEISDLMVEGLVHISDLEDDYYVFEEKAFRLKGESSGQTYRLGDAVRVKVVKVNVDERLLDFILVKKQRKSRRRRKTKKRQTKR